MRSYGVKLLNGCAGGLGNPKGTFAGCQEVDSGPVEAMGEDLHIRNLWYGISISFHGLRRMTNTPKRQRSSHVCAVLEYASIHSFQVMISSLSSVS